jgi:diguanylate cyclase (GGDEF)-like protein
LKIARRSADTQPMISFRHADGGRDRRELQVLHRISLALASSLALDEVLNTLARELAGALPRIAECNISVWDRDEGVLRDVASFPLTDAGEQASWPLTDYPSTWALLEAATGYVDASLADPTLPEKARQFMERSGWKSSIEMPLVIDGRSVGLIEIADQRSTASWSARDIAFLQTIASQAALTVRNAQLYEDLRSQVDRDPLTGLLNHRAFYERLGQELARADRAGDVVTITVIDIDNFKLINDRHGHLAGDTALRRAADALRSSCRGGDVASRIGGDEFAVILHGDEEEVESIGERLLHAVTSTGLEASLGMARKQRGEVDPIPFVDRADRSLLEAKQAGKHTYRIAS